MPDYNDQRPLSDFELENHCNCVDPCLYLRRLDYYNGGLTTRDRNLLEAKWAAESLSNDRMSSLEERLRAIQSSPLFAPENRVTGNARRRAANWSPKPTRPRFTQTPTGLVLSKNAVIMSGETHAKHRLVLLSDGRYDGVYVLPSQAVQTYEGEWVHEIDAVLFTAGQFAGQCFFKNYNTYYIRDPSAIQLIDRGWAHNADEHRCLHDDTAVLAADPLFNDLVRARRYADNPHSKSWFLPHEAEEAIVDCDGATDWVHNENLVRVDGEVYGNISDVLTHYEIGWSSRLREYAHFTHPDFYSTSEYNAGYHKLSRRNYAPYARFTVGFEVEKEDSYARTIPYGPLYQRTGWAKEHDSSLDEDSGYELVSPAFDLFDDTLDTALEDAQLIQLVNAGYSRACGGHLNFGVCGQSGRTTFDEITGYLPLIYAMFPSRAEGYHTKYCRAYKKHELANPHDYIDDTHYVSVAIHNDRVEFRVFGAVRNVKNLLLRRDLLRVMAQNRHLEADEVLANALDGDTALGAHLAKIYSPRKLLALVGRAVALHRRIEDEDLDITLQLSNQTPVAHDHAYLIA